MNNGQVHKRRIIIPIVSDDTVRNFIDSGAFDALEEDFELHFLVLSSVRGPLNKPRCTVVSNGDVARRAHCRWRSFYISMKRYQGRCSTFPVKYKETFYARLTVRQKIKADVATLPGIAEAFMAFNEFSLGTDPAIDRAISAVDPAFMVIPFAFNETFTLDCLKSALKKNIPHLAIMFNWDNVSSKGVLPFNPEHLAVWGEQTFKHAVDIQKMPPRRVAVLGAPQFECYRRPVTVPRDEWRRANGVPLDKKVVLFVGMSRFADEIEILSGLEQAIEQGALPGAHIHYRPHPWRDYRPGERNFFDRGFRHITMDIQVRDHYRRQLEDAEYRRRKWDGFSPDYRYYPALFNAVDAVISPGTTMSIEAMLMGKPVLVKGFMDEDVSFADRLINTYAHHDCWPKMPSAIVCRRKADFIPDCRRLLGLAGRGDIAGKLKEEVRYVVYQDEKLYAQRLAEHVKKIFDQQHQEKAYEKRSQPAVP